VVSEFNFIPDCTSTDPDDQSAEVISPTLRFFNTVKTEGVAIFFVTARNDEQRAVTEANLRKVGYEGWNELIMQLPNSHASSIESYKAAQRARIEAKGFRIIANIGDQFSDLAGDTRTEDLSYPIHSITFLEHRFLATS
jgi:predicted secreted acid phosphatase